MSRKRLLVIAGSATLVFDVVLTAIDARLKATGGPSILGLEFAGRGSAANAILLEWGGHGRHLARLALWLDFGFMLAYGSFLALAGAATRDFCRGEQLSALARLGGLAPYLAVAAALFDAAENVIWLLVLGGRAGQLAGTATHFAIAKFVLVGLVVGYVLIGLVVRIARCLGPIGRSQREDRSAPAQRPP